MTADLSGVKRFYVDVSTAPSEGRFAILLDGKLARTQARLPLSAPNANLAEDVANEWRGQKGEIIRSTMPLTGMLSAAIDGGAPFAEECRNDILKYASSDLVCYRASQPLALVNKQKSVWDPYVEFVRLEFGALLVTTTGISAISQSDTALAALRTALENLTPELLCALRIAAAISGSAVLALALWKRPTEAEAIFDASRIDEHFQQVRWGADAEALAREASLRYDFLLAGRFLSAL